MEEINERKGRIWSNVTTTKEKDWDGACSLSCDEGLLRKNWRKALPCWWHETNRRLIERWKRKTWIGHATKKDQPCARSSVKQIKHSNLKVKSHWKQ